jgi:hypothetical protein
MGGRLHLAARLYSRSAWRWGVQRMAPATAADDARGMSSNAASATLAGCALGTGRAARDLKAALELHDPRGVLSVYIDDAGPRSLELHGRHGPLHHLVAGFTSRWDSRPCCARGADRRARRTAAHVLGNARPRGARRVASGRTIEVPLSVAVAPFAAFDDPAQVPSIVDALHRARPAVSSASAAHLAVLELRGRTLVELEPATSPWRAGSGTAG